MNEPLRLAQFLRERCEQNLYGLCYLDPQHTLLQIPWPVVPKHNGETPPGFQIYHDWAVLSFLRRGNRDANERKETPTQEKHRFRNALARANGIVYRKDIKVDGARVYEFIANQSDFENTSVSYSPYQNETMKSNTHGHEAFELFCPGTMQWNHSTSTNDSGFIENSYNKSPVDDIPRMDQIDVDDLLQIIDDPLPQDRSHNPSRDPLSLNQNSYFSEPQYQLDPVAINDPTELEINVGFRKDDASRYYVTNKCGCRLFFGKNIPNLSQLLEKDHLDNIMRKFRYKQEYYFGPESVEQIHLPSPCEFMKSPVQKRKTEAILGNMERGLLLCVHYPDYSSLVPDIYAMRLCQTRIFPCSDNGRVINGGFQSMDSLKRMEWTKVFDGNRFYEQLHKTEQSPSSNISYPCPSFSFSLGQRPTCEDRSLLFVCLTVTVQKAQRLLQAKLDKDEEIAISHLTSIDVEAQNMAHSLAESLKIQSSYLQV